ncbi:MAG: ammonium transporter [Chloroflexi bacterium]|nr:ammonium transporter [Chloroflexota bacterium]MYA94550.1 ammonium transporter [Chloroflexota bacterium]MYC56496.1 ammonium transporter [Chloroflexota bacterium]MYD37459.1 ammonium transporter [Chloroflexota bacterium]MYE80212.1 ammonium transporter [Chloroflexota bacterium]
MHGGQIVNKRKFIYRLISIFIGLGILYSFGFGTIAQEDPPAEDATAAETVEISAADAYAKAEEVQGNLDIVWILLAGFLVFFMQAGFAMLEGGMIRETGVVNSLAENFMDACVTGIVFFIVGYGIAYGTYDAGLAGGALTPSAVPLLLSGADGSNPGDGALLAGFFFQFAFAGAAATIATGAMAERTNFVGKLIYSAILGAVIYPMVVFWTWGSGWIAAQGFKDFAGSTIVHMTGGVVALVGAYVLGPRAGRVFGRPPEASNLAIASLGTFILWVGWYGFNVGSTLAASDPNQMGLVAVNTTLAAAAGALGAMFLKHFLTGSWNVSFILNGSLAGLVGITAGCAWVTPVASIVIGALSGAVLVASIRIVENMKIDDAVGAFSVHGACGAFGTLMVGLVGSEALGAPSLLDGGSLDLFGAQLIGVLVVALWAGATSFIMFTVLNRLDVLHVAAEADRIGIDAYEHHASVWPNVLPLREVSED